ncbi:hypothetical protein SCLCIDRAFT_33037 [Scleroderma citrinum Foug A]|uniref:Uncharacterized protein n=1 Tax=Scleroderma citrinum Foug A TaxID=1036808 RepID=A0A0C3D696_9AGAM|nr:hypothetical protein SCLCIDRAFT_33037 [Scleroderma citrinum Foug A]
MVKIPELAEDGQNWKIYRVKFLEVAATFDCLEVLAGRPYEGDDWDGCNALLCCTFMESVPPSIYFKICCRTAHENFKYLVKHFCDSEPIPCANELQCAGTATAAEMPENYPMSVNAATEQHANTYSDEEDLSNSKALTRGTEDVDNRNVRRQDPRTSFEASVQGTSAKCIKTTPVVLESMPHESQDQLQDSLQVTPYACEQEAVDSVVTAERTNSTAKMAKPNVVDVDGKAALGRDLAERVHIVDEGGEEHKSPLQLPKIEFYCEESRQRSGIAKEDIPFANGLLLEGEWTVNPSGERDTSVRASVGGTGSNTGQKVEPADTPNELEQLMTMSIKPDDADGGGIPIVCLQGVSWHADDTNRPRSGADASNCRTDGSSGHANGSRGQADRSRGSMDVLRGRAHVPSQSNNAETDVVSHGDEVSSYLGVRDAKRLVLETDGARNHADTLATCTEPHSVEMHTILPANETQNTPEPIRRWRKVSVEGTDVYLLWDAPVEVPSQMFAFGQAEGADQAIALNFERAGEAIAPNVGKTARDGNGDSDGDDGDVDSTTSSGNVDSN